MGALHKFSSTAHLKFGVVLDLGVAQLENGCPPALGDQLADHRVQHRVDALRQVLQQQRQAGLDALDHLRPRIA